MNRRVKFAILFIVISALITLLGLGCWHFLKKDPNRINNLIDEYKKFESENDYEKAMLKKIANEVEDEGKNNLTLRMALMRLRYYKAVQNNDQLTIQQLHNEAGSLLGGNPPLFKQHMRNNDVRKFLMSVKFAKYEEERSYSWGTFLITCIAVTILFLITAIKNKDGGLIMVPVMGTIGGGLLYHFALIHILYQKTIVHLDVIPPVPIVI